MKVLTLPDGQDSIDVWPSNGSIATKLQAVDIVPGSGIVDSVVAGTGIAVNSSDPANPVVSNTGVLDITAGTGISVGGSAQHPSVSSTIRQSAAAVLRLADTGSDIDVPTSGSSGIFVRCSALAGQFAVDGSGFTLGANAEITYTGAPRPALIQLNATIEVKIANQDDPFAIAIDQNADTVGAAYYSAQSLAAGQISARIAQSAVPSFDLALSTCRVVTLATGDVLSPVFVMRYDSGTPTNILLEGLTMSVLLL